MARRILPRKELRADYEAAERRKAETEEATEETEEEAEEEGEEDEEEGEGGEEEGGETDEAGDEEEGGGDEDDEEAPKKKKKVAKPKPKPVKAKTTKSRSRSAKVVRMKVVWAVFNNSNQRIATYEYPKRKEADDHAARLTTDKKSTHFVQPVKEPIEEKKEA
jgi:hypothetical protein